MSNSDFAPSYTEEWVIGPRNTKYYTRRYIAAGSEPQVVLIWLHGHQEHVARYDALLRKLQTKGVSVLAVDQSGWGRTFFDKENGSGGGKYGLTSSALQLEEADFFVKREAERGSKVFLSGHSYGGQITLNYAVQKTSPDSDNLLSGVVASSPMLLPTKPASLPARLILSVLALLAPNMTFPFTPVPETMSCNEAGRKSLEDDPYVQFAASFSCLRDMFAVGEHLYNEGFNHWPNDLPVLIIHGASDRATSPVASRAFCERLPAKDKQYTLFEGACHMYHSEPEFQDKYVDTIAKWIDERRDQQT